MAASAIDASNNSMPICFCLFITALALKDRWEKQHVRETRGSYHAEEAFYKMV
jgi:hypothetical protein